METTSRELQWSINYKHQAKENAVDLLSAPALAAAHSLKDSVKGNKVWKKDMDSEWWGDFSPIYIFHCSSPGLLSRIKQIWSSVKPLRPLF